MHNRNINYVVKVKVFMKKYIIAATVVAVGCLGYWRYYHPCPFSSTCNQKTAEKQADAARTFKEGSSAERVPFEKSPKEPNFNAACPTDSTVVADIELRSLDIGFENEPHLRPWVDIEKRINSDKRSFKDWYNTLRAFLIVYMQINAPNARAVMGVSASVDQLDQVCMAIADEVALIHYQVEKGIDPAIGEDYTDHQNVAVERDERALLEILYRSCRMTAVHAFRQSRGTFTRVAFLPTEMDWKAIQKGFNLDPERGDEVLCTYKVLD